MSEIWYGLAVSLAYPSGEERGNFLVQMVSTCEERNYFLMLIFFFLSELGRCTPEKTFIFVNRRPVEFRPVEKLLQRIFSEAAGLEPTAAKFPVSVLSLELGASSSASAGLDPNLEPNKQRVGLACCAALLAGLERHLRQLYGLRSLADGGPIAAEELNDSYARLLQSDVVEGGGEIDTCKVKNPPDNIESRGQSRKGSCFTMIGQTQEDYAEETRESGRTNRDDFVASAQREDVTTKETPNTDLSRPYSPVLKAEMFASPEQLPGRDALYLHRSVFN
jgi:DNA mismatch repair ATPase MutL